MKHIYLISGFGADDRIFKNIDFGKNELHFIPWKIPHKGESLQGYAQRMRQSIHHPNPVLVGLSFGGMMCIEIAKLIATEKIVIISSVKHRSEMPWAFRLSGYLYLDKVLPLRPFKLLEPIENYNLGVVNKEQKILLRAYRKNISQQYINWSVNHILNWKNTWNPGNLIHLHGDRDRIFPIKYVKPDFIIKGGGHLMVMNQPREVNDILLKILSD